MRNVCGLIIFQLIIIFKMTDKWILIFSLFLSVHAIRVPVKRSDETASTTTQEELEEPIFMEEVKTDDEKEAQKHTEEIVETPPVYLLPPKVDAINFFKLFESGKTGQQAAWIPLQAETENKKLPESFELAVTELPPINVIKTSFIPSQELLPPLPHSIPNTDFFLPKPSEEFQLPELRPSNYQQTLNKPYMSGLVRNAKPIPLELLPPNQKSNKFRSPTNVYPKKYYKTSGFVPIPIPITDFELDKHKVTKIKKVKPFKSTSEEENVEDFDFKRQQKYQIAEDKKNFQKEQEKKKYLDSIVAESHNNDKPQYTKASRDDDEQENEEESFSEPENTQPPLIADLEGPDDRTEFRMHGLQGPNSYKFGYDTGKGRNRQFRFEERDKDGRVRGHYGYVDHTGKLTVVNYDATPEGGFRAHGPFSEPKEHEGLS